MAQIRKVNVDGLRAIIKQRVTRIMESEGVKSLGDPMKVKLNTMADEGGKLGTTVGADDPMNVDMNTEAENGTEATGAQVKVKAGAAKGNKGPTAGQHTANMEEKDSAAASVKAGGPFVEKPKEGMNKMDGTDENAGAKTFVKAGDGGVGDQPATTGQKKADFKEDAPESDEKKKRIADAIQMKEGTTFKNKAELLKYIKEEAKKISELL
jgi:hypothetical protein